MFKKLVPFFNLDIKNKFIKFTNNLRTKLTKNDCQKNKPHKNNYIFILIRI